MKKYTKEQIKAWNKQYNRAVAKDIFKKVFLACAWLSIGMCSVLALVGVLQTILCFFA